MAGRAREIALTLASWPSVTGTADEAAFAQKLADYLTGFDRVWTEAIAGDAARRSNVFALKRGRSSRTIVLTGHFDVVPIESTESSSCSSRARSSSSQPALSANLLSAIT